MTRCIVIAGTQSGVGKTTITVGIIAALRRRGLRVQPFKVGPDYIDPTYHTLAAGRPCRNLDSWMLPPDEVRVTYGRATRDADIAVIEGVMGLFDGWGYEDETGSTAHVVKLLGAPVVLVIDAGKMARSVGAVAHGFETFDEQLRLAGFIINRVGSPAHARGVTLAVANATRLPVLGCLPRQERLAIPERHLGLIPTDEPGRWQDFIDAAGETIERHLDCERLLQMAEDIEDFPTGNTAAEVSTTDRPMIAVARDEAFQFLYEDNLDRLRAAGAAIAFFSPLRDPTLPPGTAGVILSGGFPELQAARLSANGSMLLAIREAHRIGLPIYAECGGLMYLTEAIVDQAGCEHRMVDLLPGRTVMSQRLTLGYRTIRGAGDSWLLADGETVRGHEFHYSRWENRPVDLPPACYLLSPAGDGEALPEGARLGNLWASYVHLHFGAKRELASRFVAACRRLARGGTAR